MSGPSTRVAVLLLKLASFAFWASGMAVVIREAFLNEVQARRPGSQGTAGRAGPRLGLRRFWVSPAGRCSSGAQAQGSRCGQPPRRPQPLLQLLRDPHPGPPGKTLSAATGGAGSWGGKCLRVSLGRAACALRAGGGTSQPVGRAVTSRRGQAQKVTLRRVAPVSHAARRPSGAAAAPWMRRARGHSPRGFAVLVRASHLHDQLVPSAGAGFALLSCSTE